MKKLLNILSILVLMAGVVSSVRLVGMNQDNRSRASQEDGVTLCHKTGSDSNPGQTITVNENAVDAHLEHGDSLGECPSNDENNNENQNQEQEDQNNQESQLNQESDQSSDQSSQSNNQNNTNNQANSDQNSSQDSTSLNNTSNNVSSNLNTNNTAQNDSNQQANINNSTPTPIPNTFTFDIRPVTTSQGRNNLLVTLTFYQSRSQVYSKTANVSHRENGIFRGIIRGIEPGTYDVYLKTEAHLGKVFNDVNVVRGSTNWNFSSTTLIAGDFNNDNRITILDIGQLLSEYTQEETPLTDKNKKFDLNHDGIIDLKDLTVILRYYNSLSVTGENI